MGEQPGQPAGKLSQQPDGRARCACRTDPALPAVPGSFAHMLFSCAGGIYSHRCQEFGRDAAGEDNKFLFRRNVPPRPEEKRTIKND